MEWTRSGRSGEPIIGRAVRSRGPAGIWACRARRSGRFYARVRRSSSASAGRSRVRRSILGGRSWRGCCQRTRPVRSQANGRSSMPVRDQRRNQAQTEDQLLKRFGGRASAAVLRDVRKRVNKGGVRNPHVPALNRQAGVDFGAMFCRDLFHNCAPLDFNFVTDNHLIKTKQNSCVNRT